MYPVKIVDIMFITLAFGYIVCILANKEKGALRTLGFTIGIVIIVGCLVLALLRSYNFGAGCLIGKSMAKHHRAMMR